MNYVAVDVDQFDTDCRSGDNRQTRGSTSTEGRREVPRHVQDAIRDLLRWTGEDPDREGLIDTPNRVGRAWREYCAGYATDPELHLRHTASKVSGYDEVVLLKDIPFQSRCEHDLTPITGTASIAYLPSDRVVGISRLVSVLHGYARRLQIQERLTSQIAQCIWDNLQPQGVAVVIQAHHGSMTGRGVRTPGVALTTNTALGCFLTNDTRRKQLHSLMHRN